jgi:uncharacterized protein YpmS
MSQSADISTENGAVSFEIHESKEGFFVLQKYIQKYDSEEVFYKVRVTPDSAGLFGDIESASNAAKELLELE